MSVKQQHQIECARTVFDFCFADEPKTNEFQIALGIESNNVKDGFYTFIEECLIAEFTRIYLDGRVTETIDQMGFKSIVRTSRDPANHLHFLDYQFEMATDKEAFLDVVKERVLRPGKTFANDVLHSHEPLDSQFRSEIKDWLSGAKRANKTFKKTVHDNSNSKPTSSTKAFEHEKPLFKHPKDIDIHLSVLKKIKTPLLPIVNDEGVFNLGGPKSKRKGAVVAWIEILQKKGIVNYHPVNRLAVLVNELIPGLEISGRSFGNIGASYNAYYSTLVSLVDLAVKK